MTDGLILGSMLVAQARAHTSRTQYMDINNIKSMDCESGKLIWQALLHHYMSIATEYTLSDQLVRLCHHITSLQTILLHMYPKVWNLISFMPDLSNYISSFLE